MMKKGKWEEQGGTGRDLVNAEHESGTVVDLGQNTKGAGVGFERRNGTLGWIAEGPRFLMLRLILRVKFLSEGRKRIILCTIKDQLFLKKN